MLDFVPKIFGLILCKKKQKSQSMTNQNHIKIPNIKFLIFKLWGSGISKKKINYLKGSF